MCLDPITMMTVGTVISGAGTVLGGFSAMKTGRAQAAQLQQQAQLRQAKAQFDSEMVMRRFERNRGSKLAGIAATGISAESFYDVLADDAAEAALEREAIKFGATADVANLQARANDVRAQGDAAFVGSLFSAAGSMASGFGKKYAVLTKSDALLRDY